MTATQQRDCVADGEGLRKEICQKAVHQFPVFTGVLTWSARHSSIVCPLQTPNITVYATKLVIWFEFYTKMYCFSQIVCRRTLTKLILDSRQSVDKMLDCSSRWARSYRKLHSRHMWGSRTRSSTLWIMIYSQRNCRRLNYVVVQYTFKCTWPPVKQLSTYRLLH